VARESRPRTEQALRLLGLAARAGGVVPGTDRVRIAARRDEVEFVLVAADASANAREKLLPLLRARGVPYMEAYSRVELGRAVGRSPLSAIGLTDVSLTGRVRELIGESGVQE
jgi:ribosomal protein L7Ae-like RNA K-turn-binding protein